MGDSAWVTTKETPTRQFRPVCLQLPEKIMEKAKNVKQTINGCGNLAFLEHEICTFSSSAVFEFRGAEMTDVRNKNRAKQSKTNLCYLLNGSKSGKKKSQF